LLVEGGGITVSRFIEARALDRLHVTIGPLLVGSGRPGIILPGIDRVDQALRPVTRRFELGSDVLFDCRLGPET
jgi:riboflavin biosynthesis pyrimidine reductase